MRVVMFVMVVAGCTNGAEVQLSDGGLYAALSVQPAGNVIFVGLSRVGKNPSHDAAMATDCVQLDTSTKISANGTAGTISDYGAYHPIGTTGNCEAPMMSVSLVPFPSSIDVALSDDSATLHIDLEADASGKYQVTRCDAAACGLSQY